MSKIPEMAEKYIEEVLPLWKRVNVNTDKTDEASKILTREKCVLPAKGPYNDTKGQPGFDRLTILLPEVISLILVFPPVKGDAYTFQAILEHIHDKGFHTQSDTVILFAPPFYSNTKADANKNILANFLKFKLSEKTKAIVHVLTQHTDANKMIGCQLYSEADEPNKPLVNMLEPTYVMYPFTRTVEDQMVSSILLSACAANEVDLPASNMRQVSSVSSYFTKGGRGSLAFPPNITTKDYHLNKMLPPYMYRFYGNGAHTFDNNYIVIDLKGGDDTEARRQVQAESDRFIGLDDDRLSLDGIRTKTVRILDMPYSVREPTGEVMKDWLESKFTMDEAELLNKLQITPSVLNSEVFQRDGQGMLADFLKNMINSKCYSDKDLLTREECSVSEDFIDKVFSHLLVNDKRIHEGLEAMKSRELREEKQEADYIDALRRADAAEEEEGKWRDALKRFKKRFGLDESVTDESLLRNPYEEGVLVDTAGADAPLFNQVFQDADDENNKYYGKYYMFIGSVNRIMLSDDEDEPDYDNLVIGRLYVDVHEQKEVPDAVDEALKKMEKEYPGWEFIKQIDNTDSDSTRPATTPADNPAAVVAKQAPAVTTLAVSEAAKPSGAV